MEQMEQTAHSPSPLPGQKQDILSHPKITPESDFTQLQKIQIKIKPGNLSYNCRSFF